LEEQLGNLFKGLKRRFASDVQDGLLDIKIGKDPFEFSFNKMMANTFLINKRLNLMVSNLCNKKNQGDLFDVVDFLHNVPCE
jgi:hypothetical protein